MLELNCEKVLVIAPHPDDEIFGCGGTIHRWKQAGAKVYVLYVTVGTTQDFSPKGQSTAEERIDEIEKVASFLGLDGYAIAFPGDDHHLKLDALPQKSLIHAIERGGEISLEEIRPDIVLTPSKADYNQDHRAVSDATFTAVRPASPAQKSFQPAILTYELPYHQWNVADVLPTAGLFVKLDDRDLEAKVKALELYQTQLKHPDNPLSTKGVMTMAAFRGLQCGASAAEAFQIGRLVV